MKQTHAKGPNRIQAVVKKHLSAILTATALLAALYFMQPSKTDNTHRATVLPDRIILTWTDDPATTQAVSWRTAPSIGQSYAQIALAGDGPIKETDAQQVAAKTTPLITELGKHHYHAAQFADLQPQTLYAYRVGDGVNWSAWNHFRTAASTPEPLTFLYFGDAQNNLRSHWSRVIRQAYSAAPSAQFMLHVGDLIDSSGHDSEWGEWFQAGGWINAMLPSIAIPGNHEYPRGVGRKLPHLSRYWRPQFQFPENGPESLKETAFWFDIQGVRLVCLNSNERIEEQSSWLETALSNNPNRWTVVAHHHPIYSATSRDNPQLREAWQPIYDKYRVDIVLQGHDHSYGRTNLMTYDAESADATVQSSAGTVYVVSVSGPKQYSRNDFEFARRAEDTQLFQVITVVGDELQYEARTATGRLYDAFTLQKQPGQTNKLIDQTPDTPENLRGTPRSTPTLVRNPQDDQKQR